MIDKKDILEISSLNSMMDNLEKEIDSYIAECIKQYGNKILIYINKNNKDHIGRYTSFERLWSPPNVPDHIKKEIRLNVIKKYSDAGYEINVKKDDSLSEYLEIALPNDSYVLHNKNNKLIDIEDNSIKIISKIKLFEESLKRIDHKFHINFEKNAEVDGEYINIFFYNGHGFSTKICSIYFINQEKDIEIFSSINSIGDDIKIKTLKKIIEYYEIFDKDDF